MDCKRSKLKVENLYLVSHHCEGALAKIGSVFLARGVPLLSRSLAVMKPTTAIDAAWSSTFRM